MPQGKAAFRGYLQKRFVKKRAILVRQKEVGRENGEAIKICGGFIAGRGKDSIKEMGGKGFAA